MNSSFQLRSWLFSNLANFITMTRLLLAWWLIFLAIFEPTRVALMCALAVVCALTDLLDGWLARRLGIVSKLGGFLDRLADKVFICSLIIFLAWGRDFNSNEPGWLKTLTQGAVGGVIFLEGLLVAGAIYGACKNLNTSSNIFGKIKMTLESVALVFWFVSLLVDQRYRLGMFWPLVITDGILLASIFYAIKSVLGYYQNFFCQPAKS